MRALTALLFVGRALTAEEIGAIHKAGQAGLCTN